MLLKRETSQISLGVQWLKLRVKTMITGRCYLIRQETMLVLLKALSVYLCFAFGELNSRGNC